MVGQFRSAGGLVLLGGGSLGPQKTCRPPVPPQCMDWVTLMWRLSQKSSFGTLPFVIHQKTKPGSRHAWLARTTGWTLRWDLGALSRASLQN